MRSNMFLQPLLHGGIVWQLLDKSTRVHPRDALLTGRRAAFGIHTRNVQVPSIFFFARPPSSEGTCHND